MVNNPRAIKHIVFDLGGVLIDWNPRYLYRKIFETEAEVDHFLTQVCDHDWNELQDQGRDLAEGTAERIARFPEYKQEIEAFYGRWTEMLGGPNQPVVELLGNLVRSGAYNLFSITNWSHQTFPIARKMYSFLSSFQDIVISGVEKVKKPDPRIFQILLDRQQIQPRECLFIDDSLRNVEGAQQMNMHSIHYRSPDQLLTDMRDLGIFV